MQKISEKLRKMSSNHPNSCIAKLYAITKSANCKVRSKTHSAWQHDLFHFLVNLC